MMADLRHAPLKTSIAAIMMCLEIGSVPSFKPADQKGAWPKDFLEALTRSDWRDWVAAVKKEVQGWNDNNTTTEVKVSEMQRGASVIPLGELLTRKRDGSAKFRQYAMGNLLKSGKDYLDTFSTSVSADAFRWFCSLACACEKQIWGWDATTGYLQAEQRTPVYAFLPSHYRFSNLTYEELAKFRAELLELIKSKGPGALKALSSKLKKETRQQPKTVLQINSAVYGIPDAGQAFAMLMQALHIKKCGLTQCQIDPSIYFSYVLDDHGNTKEYIIVITWTDDVRYFGTPNAVKNYESTVSREMKCTMEGKSTSFVSITIKQDLYQGTLELTQPEYWTKAVTRFKEYLPGGTPKARSTPLSPYDFAQLTEVTDEDVKEAENLPYPQLLGVIQFPAAFTKLEMRYAVSTLSRFRGRWGTRHFKAAIKALEYGYTSRDKGILYTKPQDKTMENILVAYADSGFSVPRSQGGRCVMMNGAAISFASRRHTTTDDSTTAAELTELFMCSCDVEGLRHLMEEVGLCQQNPTTIFQDNIPAIQIAMNRGQLAKKTKAMSLRTLSVRNKIEDAKVVPEFTGTDGMIADIGTKALDVGQFQKLRDLLTGYSGRKGRDIKSV
jgi:hypothetical protein